MNTIERDKQTIRQMVEVYCRRRLGQPSPSEEYRRLADYACQRLDRCRFGDRKPACKDCPVHCYRPQEREQIRRVMRWAGPRMLLYSPRAAFRHLAQAWLAKLHKPHIR